MADLVPEAGMVPATREVLEDNRLRRDFVDDVVAALEADDSDGARALAAPLHPADIADLFELIPATYRQPLAEALGDTLDADVIAEMNDWVREALLDVLSASQVADVVSELDTDDAVSIVEELDPDEQREVLRALDPDDRAAIEEALSYPEESAGRLMQRELVAVPEHWSIGQVIDFLGLAPDLASDFWEIFVVDPGHKPIGTMRLSWVLTTPRSIAVADVMQREQSLIPVDLDQEEVAFRFQKYALISAAVVDPVGRLVGVITVDDIVHIIQDEASQDVLRLAGAGDGDINEPLRKTIPVRMWWLLINLGTAILASSVVAAFESTIAKLVTLAVLMPIVAGMGGNAATQTMTVTVRALATNQLTSSNSLRMIGRELAIACANGLGFGILMGIACQLVYHDTGLSLVLFAAMAINSLVAGLSGVIVPLVLERFEIDPAVTSTVFVTTMTDVMGFFSFLGLAALFGLTSTPG
ncbi:magnesium transporter [Polymorphobacter arshaanensis]|uniref:Magnesium transporter MgtE n=1 Tax=Glacieibacterium arshaanense TaxID=2511025 RepID=A0A4Y9EMK4_9SPHN|nr:magnesium transporter [Polymorphobacter arshaanensis]TFU03242.1 magnesium transporter [Polymorphobacter arshaanensis]